MRRRRGRHRRDTERDAAVAQARRTGWIPAWMPPEWIERTEEEPEP